MRVSLQKVMERYRVSAYLSSFYGCSHLSEEERDGEVLGVLLNALAAAVVAMEAYDAETSGDHYYIPRAGAMNALRRALKDVTL